MSYVFCPSDAHADREQILQLWCDNLPGASPARYPWLYEEGPSTGWLVKADEAATVGAVGLMGRTMSVFGMTRQAGQPIDLNINADHRTVGPALGLQRTLISTVTDGPYELLYAFPNAASEPVQRRAGFRVLGTLGRWAKPLVVGRHVLSRVRNPVARRVVSVVGGPVLRLASRETYYRRPRTVRVAITDRFDARFDRLWESAAERFPIVGERTSAFLTWRFGKCPAARYEVLCLSTPDDELLGYVVFHHLGGKLHIGDLFFSDPSHLDTLLAELLRLARRRRAEAVVVVYLGNRIVRERLRHFGFWQRPCEWKTLLFVGEQLGADGDRLFDVENWHLTHADIDTDE